MLKWKTAPSCSRLHSSVPGMSNVGGKDYVSSYMQLSVITLSHCQRVCERKRTKKSIGALMYTKGAHHLKAFSGLKINCGVHGEW